MRTTVLIGTIAVLLTTAACGGEPASPRVTGPTVSAPAEAPKTPPAWESGDSLGLETGIFVVGDVVLTERQDAVVALDRASGRALWHRSNRGTSSPGPRMRVSGSLAVFVYYPGQLSSPGKVEFEVVDVKTGRMAWQGSATAAVHVFDTAIYLANYQDGAYSTMRHDIRDGSSTWAAPVSGGIDDELGDFRFGPAQYEPAYLAFRTPLSSSPWSMWSLFETSTGTALPIRAENRGWPAFSVGDLLIVPDNDIDGGHSRPTAIADADVQGECPVALQAYDGHSGAVRYTAVVHNGRTNGDCRKRLMRYSLAGDNDTGSRIATANAAGATQLFDLVAGTPVRESDTRATAYDVDDRSLLVAEQVDGGGLALLDTKSGERQKSVPLSDLRPGEAHLVGDRIVVGGRRIDTNDSRVTVYDRATGHELRRYDGNLIGAGPDWIAVLTQVSGKGVLEFHT